MTSRAWSTCRHLVLDTNVVLALWLFADPVLRVLSQLITHQKVQLWTRQDALLELTDVLSRTCFALSAAQQAAILNTYRKHCKMADECIVDSSSVAALPLVGDADDQKFLEIARDSTASHLLTRDKLLLQAGRHSLARALFVTETPERFCMNTQTAMENGTIRFFNQLPDGQEQSS